MLGEVLETQEHSQSLLSYAAHVPVKGWVFDKSLTACESPEWIQPVLGPFKSLNLNDGIADTYSLPWVLF